MITSNMKYSFVTHILKPALIMTCLFVLTSVTAMAQAPCAPVDISAPSDPALQIFELEGKINTILAAEANESASAASPFQFSPFN